VGAGVLFAGTREDDYEYVVETKSSLAHKMLLEAAGRKFYGFIERFGAAALSIVAFIFSLYSFYQSESTQNFVFQNEAIKTEYDIYRELSKLQHDNPFLTHLFAQSPATYFYITEQIRTALEGTPPREKTKLLLEERSLAHFIFTTYEQTYYQWQTAVQANNRHLAVLLADNLDFFDKFLCNSRLVWFWDNNNNDQMSDYFSKELVSYYKSHVHRSCAVTPDSSGPIGLSSRQNGGQNG